LQFKLLKYSFGKHTATNQLIQDVIDFTELGNFIYAPVKTYSSGMMLRLSFSILKMIRPEIILLDEVLSAGDLIFQKKADELMKMHFKESRAVIMASHNLHEMAQYCNRVIHLEKGEILNDGKVDELLQQYIISGIMRFDPENALKKQAVYVNRKQLNTGAPVSLIDIAVSNNENFEPVSDIYINDFIYCRIAFKNMTDKKIKMSLDIHTLNDIWIMTTSPNLNECPQGFEQGDIVCVMQLPALLLNTGIYSVSLRFHNENNDTIQHYQKIIYFKLKEYGFSSSSENSIKGILRIPVKWTIQ
jgi:ABC-type proline/glycine betaine transport system ATPase subunit